MIKINDDFYYLDLKNLNKEYKGYEDDGFVVSDTETITYDEGGDITHREVNKVNKTTSNYDTINLMLDIVLNSDYEYGLDDNNRNLIDKAPFNFTIAFNTLIKLKIIVKL